ncbi:hypothetical protein ADK65_14040 [Streptomyces sp. NRRL B-1140]|nr:hypothetical protein ADK65_14040 [Streptomyces sp. NRRL B-1140]
MRASVTLSVRAGDRTRHDYRFTEPGTCLVGRAPDCGVRIGTDDSRVSRLHCLLDLDPPEVRVRDLGSRNGTYVNGVKVDECSLAHGDEIRIGRTMLRVSVTAPAPSGLTSCRHCGLAVPGTGSGNGETICGACRRTPRAVLIDLLNRVSNGDAGPKAAHGYQVLREIGRGGQGVVYLARHESSGELRAFKVLLSEAAVDPYARNGFLREIENTRALRHPNIVEFRDSGALGAAFFLACEFCEGGSVDQLTVPLPPERAVKIALGVLDGLAYAHDQGLVHRDIKPQNILLSGPVSARVPKLADFGLAKAFENAGLSGHTRTGSLGGSVAFMSRPQVIDYKFAKPEVDVWSAAASLYWLLTGSAPRRFPARTDPVMVVLSETAVPIRERAPSLPRRLAAVVDEALVDSPRIPIGTAAELRRALSDALP